MSPLNKILERLSKLHPKIIDLSLDRVEILLKKLGSPHLQIPSPIHIAGTNGKGSTLSFIKAGLEAEDKLVHTYSSPHLVKFNERVQLAGKTIDDALLIQYLETCASLNDSNHITFFEIITCAAFLAFSEQEASYSLIEVGLGGKLDATNVIKSPIISIITPISLDHQQFLGDTVLEIACEKAGILRAGVPAIIGKQTDEVQQKICSIAEDLGTPLSIFGRDWSSKPYKNNLIYENNDGVLELPSPKLEGDHQFENAGIAITALKLLKSNTSSLKSCMQKVKWPARLHKLTWGPLIKKCSLVPFNVEIWIDGGHNQAAAQAIASFLSKPYNGTSHIILGMLNSKDRKAFISQIAAFSDSIGCVNIPNETASMNKKDLLKEAKNFQTNSFEAKSISTALDTIINHNKAYKDMRIIICGSLYLCGHILKDHS